MREKVEKYPPRVGFEPGILAQTASTITTFDEMTGFCWTQLAAY